MSRILVCLLGCLALVGCKPAGPTEDKLVVFAAASLREGFTTLGDTFQRTHPGVEVTFNFAGTQELRTQLEHGAAVDAFASADQQHVQALLDAGRVMAPVVFARNELVLVVSKEASGTIHSLADLPMATRVVIGASEVPVGRYTLQVLDRAGARLGDDFRARVEAKVVSRELNVRQVLTRVALGEAEAGVVYRTDVGAAKGQVTVVPIASELNVLAEYRLAIVVGAAHPGLARAWVELVRSPEGQAVLRATGFLPAVAP